MKIIHDGVFKMFVIGLLLISLFGGRQNIATATPITAAEVIEYVPGKTFDGFDGQTWKEYYNTPEVVLGEAPTITGDEYFGEYYVEGPNSDPAIAADRNYAFNGPVWKPSDFAFISPAGHITLKLSARVYETLGPEIGMYNPRGMWDGNHGGQSAIVSVSDTGEDGSWVRLTDLGNNPGEKINGMMYGYNRDNYFAVNGVKENVVWEEGDYSVPYKQGGNWYDFSMTDLEYVEYVKIYMPPEWVEYNNGQFKIHNDRKASIRLAAVYGVPEPTSILLLGLSGLTLIARRRVS